MDNVKDGCFIGCLSIINNWYVRNNFRHSIYVYVESKLRTTR